MLIYQQDNVRVTQHPFLNIFNVEKFQNGDWVVIEQTSLISRAGELVDELIKP